MKKKLSVILAALMLLAALTGCGGSPSPDASAPAASTPPAGGDTTDPATGDNSGAVMGTGTEVLRVAMAAWKEEITRPALDVFEQKYNVKVEIMPFEGTEMEWLTAKAAENDMPDVIYSIIRPMPYFASQGWLYPMENFFAADAESTYVPQEVLSHYTHNGRLYGIPERLYFTLIVINNDLMNELNIELPALDWSWEDYKNFLVAGTNDKYSGTESLPPAEYLGAGMVSANEHTFSYIFEEETFKLTSGWLQGHRYLEDLKSVPGLAASTLRSEENNNAAYIAKFGEGDTSISDMAMRLGKILSTPSSTGSQSSHRAEYSFDWAYHTWPQEPSIGIRVPVSMEYTSMGANTEYPELAFELAKWLSFGEEGVVERLKVYEEKDVNDKTNGSLFIIPPSNNPKIVEAFSRLGLINEAVLYMLEHFGTSMRSDFNAIVPGYAQTFDDYLEPAGKRINEGEDPAAIAAEVEASATASIQSSIATFNADLAKVQAEFDSTHG